MASQTSFDEYPQQVATAARTMQADSQSLQPQTPPPGQALPVDPEQERQQKELEEVRKNLFEWDQAKPRLNKLKGFWNAEVNATIERRLYRKVDLSPRGLRESGRLKPDETIVPMRVIDTNIRRENPAYVNYLVSPARQYIFDCLANPAVDSQTIQNLEKDVTTGLRYPGWERAYFKVFDGAQLHGWDATEVVFDPSKPLHVDSEHIGHENLFFSVDALDINSCEVLMRRYSISAMQLRSWVSEFGFDPHQVQIALDIIKGIDRADQNFILYKVFFKWQKVVYVAWCSLEFCDDWLKKPEKLKLGIKKQVQVMKQVPQQVPGGIVPHPTQPGKMVITPPSVQMIQQPTMEWQDVDIVDYPIFLNVYLITEEQPIIMAIGRGFLDKYMQEAQTSIATGFCNTLTRASNVYGSVAGDPSSTAEPKQLSTPLNNGALYDKEIKFFTTPQPDPQCIQALEYFGTKNTEDAGQISYAANDRVDSRKTATEITSAEQTQQQLSTVQVSLLSIYLTLEGNFKWLIIQSQALQGLVNLLQVPGQPQLTPNGGSVPSYINNIEMIGKQYILKPAGSVDVVERQKMLQQMRGDWPVLQQTPLALEFMKEFIRQAYPNQANRWIQILDQQQDENKLIATMAAMLQHLMQTDPNISPQDKQTLQQVVQAANQLLNPVKQAQTQDGKQAGQPQQGQGQQPQQQKAPQMQ